MTTIQERIMGERHVVRCGEGGWKVVGPSAGAAEARTASQADAIEEACAELWHNGGGEVHIHGVTGLVQDRRTIRAHR